ncbi:MAG: hypothetical protein ABI036_07235 [Fibrobacteria bacterium]
MIRWLEIAGVIWMALTLFTISLRAVTAMLLRQKTRQLSRAHAQVHGLQQQEQHVRRLSGEIDTSRRSRQSILVAAPTLEETPLC